MAKKKTKNNTPNTSSTDNVIEQTLEEVTTTDEIKADEVVTTTDTADEEAPVDTEATAEDAATVDAEPEAEVKAADEETVDGEPVPDFEEEPIDVANPSDDQVPSDVPPVIPEDEEAHIPGITDVTADEEAPADTEATAEDAATVDAEPEAEVETVGTVSTPVHTTAAQPVKAEKKSIKRNIRLGAKLELVNEPLYTAYNGSAPTKRITGTYYVYDGIVKDGKFRITDSKQHCGKNIRYIIGCIAK